MIAIEKPANFQGFFIAKKPDPVERPKKIAVSSEKEPMKLKIISILILLPLLGIVRSAHAAESIKDIDFNNFTYTLRPGGMGPSGEITFTQGGYRDGFSYAAVRNVYYADLNADGNEDALVVLTASGGGSGFSPHAYGFSYQNGQLEEILYLLNFINIRPYGNGFILIRASPLSNNSQTCPPNFIMRVNAIDAETYQWDGSNFVLVDKTTVRGEQACNFR